MKYYQKTEASKSGCHITLRSITAHCVKLTGAVVLLSIINVSNVWAQQLFVDAGNGEDVGLCDVSTNPCQTIGFAISLTVPGDTIDLLGNTPFNESDLAIPHSLVISGQGPNQTVIDAGNADRIFTVNGVSTVIDGVSLINGDASSAAVANGGAILLESGELLVSRTQITDNTAAFGGAIATVSGAGTVSVFASDVSNNHATASGGGIWCEECDSVYVTFSRMVDNVAGVQGGAIYANGAPVNIWTSYVSRNNADDGGAIYANYGLVTVRDSELADNEADSGNGGAIYAAGDLSIQRSTLAGNTSAFEGGAVFMIGGGALASANSTYSGNNAMIGGALSLATNLGLGPDVLIGTSTFYNNQASFPTGAEHFAGSWFNFQLFNSIVTGGINGGPICFSALDAGMNNLIDSDNTDSCDTGIAGFNLGAVVDFDQNLAYNGGITRTHLIGSGSNAVDNGLNSACLNPATSTALILDQRSRSRPVDFQSTGLAVCDIGAVELQ